jgi:hypothetical protein
MGDAILLIRITTRDPLCADATITVNVSTDGTTFTAYTYPGDPGFSICGSNCLTFTHNYGSTLRRKTSAGPPTLFVYLESASGGTAVDRAPDAGAGVFVLCDFDPKYHKNYDENGDVIPPCNPPGGNYFE